MTQSATQHRASLFASGGKRARDIIGKRVGKFTVNSYVGKDASSESVYLSCQCGNLFARRRSELSRVAKQTYCAKCSPRSKGAKKEHHARAS